jgi:hypothetical protein
MGNGRFRDPSLEAIVEPRQHKTTPLHSLMARRVTNILLVSSLYDSFTFEDEGGLSELLFAEYLELNLRYAPRIVRVSTGDEALGRLRTDRFDLVISMRRVGDMDISAFSSRAHQIVPGLPVLLLAYNTRELELLESAPLPHVDRTFVWQGDHRLFVAMIKYVEDRLNVEHDAKVAGVQAIILVEDSARFYSAYLPLLYSELVRQTQLLMSDSVNTMQRLIRMRARPKLLLATTFEDGLALYRKYREHVLGVIVDVAFPRNGVRDYQAGIDFARMVKEEDPERPVLLQSSDASNREHAHRIHAGFIHKHSPSLLAEVRDYMRTHLGFGPFIFRLPGGTEVTRAEDLESLASALLWIPEDSLLYHARHNHFSTWLMARTEFDLAYALRARKTSDFRGAEDIRRHLHDALMERQEESLAGVVAEFPVGAFRGGAMFVRIGTGSLGGKGRGLAFMNALFTAYKIKRRIPGVRIQVPPTAILATSVFDEFMEAAGLLSQVLEEQHTDDEITQAFLDAPFPDEVRSQLRRFLQKVHYPLAVRSSSLLEDASFQPFAGVYRTYMIPNNAEDLEARLEELLCAIRLVYASTYYADARSYLESTPNRLEEEKMAVVVQQLVGRRYGDYHYPNVAGTARSRDFYPVPGIAPEDGVAVVALGLGNTVMDGGKALRFSPAHPHKLYQFANVEDYLRHSQRDFSALDLSRPGPCPEAGQKVACSNLAELGLDVAEEHETLHAVGSVYHHENHAIYDGISRPGPRLVTMSGILKSEVFPLAKTLQFLLKVGEAGFSAPVEMEFAVKLRARAKEPHEFGFLQIRPLGSTDDIREVDIEVIEEAQAIVVSRRALGNGIIEGVCDLVYVRPDTFDRAKSTQVAQEIGQINRTLRQDGRHCVLIGQGRWGSSDPWLGIPVGWSQISMARCMVETDLKDIRVEPSQGTHFFQNITSLGIGYFTVNFGQEGGILDYQWLDSQPARSETHYVRHLHFQTPLEIVLDGRKGVGVVMKPGSRVVRRGEASHGEVGQQPPPME